MIKMNLPVTARLSIVKNILSFSLILTIACTWPLWSADRYYPLFPEQGFSLAINPLLTYILPSLLLLSLVLVFIFRRPRFFIFLSVLLGATLIILDEGRMQYWFWFYLLLFLVLLGYNWRVDNMHHYSSYFNAIKVVVAATYFFSSIQHFQSAFFSEQWPAFIKPFERFWTPEQCAYLLKACYLVPVIELFVVVGLFLRPTRIAAISFSLLLHLFTLLVLFMQPAQPAVIIWHLAMMGLVIFVFAGKTSTQRNSAVSFAVYPAVIIIMFGMALPVYLQAKDRAVNNKMDLMQTNMQKQYIYLDAASQQKLPYYIQSFAMQKQETYYRLCVTGWVLHETKTKQVLAPVQLIKLCTDLTAQYGASALVSLPSDNKGSESLALK